MADDHPIVRRGMADLLADEPDLEVVALCADGREALEAVEARRPDVAVLDLRMPEPRDRRAAGPTNGPARF